MSGDTVGRDSRLAKVWLLRELARRLMTPERWQQFQRIYGSGSRARRGASSYLAEACVGDEGLRRESKRFWPTRSRRAFHRAASVAAPGALAGLSSISIGQLYRPLRDRRVHRRGRDGRGVSRPRYEAHRDVAIKVLPPVCVGSRTAGPVRARGAAARALNHPHIAAVHGLEPLASIARWSWSSWKVPRWRIGSPVGRCRRGGAARRVPDRRGARGRARERHRPSRSEASQHQAPPDGIVKMLDFGLAKALRPLKRTGLAHSPAS